ncbi:MAG: cytochrome-c peroxidase [Candidatus Thiodiazotropha sp. (ex Ustalcina ferruginea)]|nr:cytochrome-c peroxidase [Candidatus Thiodiazotropha sp. (ex Ustalcina ferruginea)]
MGLKRVGVAIVAAVVTVSCGGGGGGDDSNDGNTPNTTTISMVELGKKLFFDTNLSSGSNQS